MTTAGSSGARIARTLAAVVVSMLAVGPTLAQGAADYQGRVLFAGRAVPGATATAVCGDRRVTTASDIAGLVRFEGLAAGVCVVTIEMTGFARVTREIAIPAIGPAHPWELSVLTALPATATPARPVATPAARPAVPPPDDAVAASAADGFVVNGSVNNTAASPFAQPRGFGNNRPQVGSLYTGAIGASGGTSRWDARPFSFGRAETSAPVHADLQFTGTYGGPLKPWRRSTTAPKFVVSYEGSSRQTTTTESLLVPTFRERAGDFSQSTTATGVPVSVIDPATSALFGGSVIPADRINAQAAALLRLYPVPNVEGGSSVNFEAAVPGAVRQDDLQARVTHVVGRNIYAITFALQRATAHTRSAFGFDDGTVRSGVDGSGAWNHRFTSRFALRARYQFTRLSQRTTPAFANLTNISGDAGIDGNDQTPANWGPPRLVFPGLATLGDVAASRSTPRTNAVNIEAYLNRGRHTVTVGGDVRHVRHDVLSQRDARGTLTFTGAATGVPFADFLLGLPATSAIGVGNADKHFRSSSLAAYVSDDARLSGTVTLTLGLRWEFDRPVTEALGRLANLDIAPGFESAATVTAGNAIGAATGRRYSAALVTPDYLGIQPRVAVAWRPIAGSSLTIRAGFGVYRNAGLSASIASALAEQPPFARTAFVDRSADHPITLADGFLESAAPTTPTFAIDPDIHAGFTRTWQVSVQRDLPASLLVVASYLGSQGRHLLQQSLPNSVPPGGVNPCASCPSGFVYLTSSGRASRHAMQVLLRRRLRSGFAASAVYTLSRAMDDASTFGGGVPAATAIIQDWLDPGAEWAPSSFDQRHVLAAQFQYTTGVGRAGGTLSDGWVAALRNGWTIAGVVNAGSGLPATPIVLVPIPGTGIAGIRPDLTGAPIGDAQDGAYANPLAFRAPAAGQWGNAGRNSLRGQAPWQVDLTVSRSFAWGSRRTVECRADVTNALNHATFVGLHTTVGSPLFGLPSAANPMRKIQTSLRVRF